MTSSASFSPCRIYRYELWRSWNTGGKVCMFIGLNPSTADESKDDPTIRRCIRFAQDWGYDELCMTNLFAFRATDPKVMKAAPSPIGPDNDATLLRLSTNAAVVVAAWGVHGDHRDRARQVLGMIPNLTALRLTKDGTPSHPLYLPANLSPFKIFSGPGKAS